ncbi:cytochrome b/b6 domain-containing protein [Streptomyces actuosus]|uniref:Cytochrome b/b6 domain-containing protein n=1 Tax=Streptomyces actuosus TaxID=1885 RepID=A0ABS2VTI7_STRAS|nr:cytochrome b/b6 domain-containing protein [Streptomyces actuosus]MBN0046275.1 cytochrome b/b6 domain-containing protein [Streptomyces actuosus]
MNPRRSTTSLPKPGRSAYGAASVVVLLLIPVIVLIGGEWLRNFLNFGAGVLSLVSLSCSVIWGLVAQDRLLLNIRQRIIGQAVHRTTAVASIAFLLVHITIKLALDHTELIAAVIPFSLGFSSSGGLIGLGSLAGLLMIFVGITGALRSNFAAPAPVAARWRAMHMLAYPAWCAALVHGLYAGRPAKPIFTILYGLSVLGVMAALALRAAPRPVKRKVADRIMELLGTEDRPGREDLDTSRARAADTGSTALPGYEGRRRANPAESPAAPLFDAPEPAEPAGSGFSAAYRAVSSRGRGRQQYATGETAYRDVPQAAQPTETLPRVDSGGSTSGSWPIPSPPPVGEAPPSAYDPLTDTGYTVPTYGNPGAGGYDGRDVYDTGETNTGYGTYNQNDTYNSGPATEPLPGTFDAPGSGEPWNMPSGGYR